MKDNLIWQVTSLELSKRLEELNFKRDSLWYWVKDYDECKGWQLFTQGQMCGEPDDYYEFDKNHLEGYEYYSAFTAAELGEMLPENYKGEKIVVYKTNNEYFCETWDTADLGAWANTDANVKAKILIYLIENKLIKTE